MGLGPVVTLMILASGIALQAQPTIGAVANAYSIKQPLSPGSRALIVGSNLGAGSIAVTIAGKAAPVFFFLPGVQVELGVQIPVDAPLGSTTVIVGSSKPFPITLAQYGPALFADPTTGRFFNINPSKAGDTISLEATGLGATNPVVPTGTPAPQGVKTVASVTATIGGKTATVSFAGLTAGKFGEYQVDIVIPPGLSSGDQPVVITVGGVNSQQGAFVPIIATPLPSVSSVVDLFKIISNLAPGGQAYVVGSNLGGPSAVVKVGGKTAPVLASSGPDGGSQLNIHIPFELSPGATSLTVTTASGSSAAFNINLVQFAPVIGSTNASNPGAGSAQLFRLAAGKPVQLLVAEGYNHWRSSR